jgi:hypothetical protein
MQPVDIRTLDVMRFASLALGVAIALFAMFQYVHGVRPDSAEIRDLLLVAALEIAFVPLAITFLLPHRDDLIIASTGVKRGTSVPNPWAY